MRDRADRLGEPLGDRLADLRERHVAVAAVGRDAAVGIAAAGAAPRRPAPGRLERRACVRRRPARAAGCRDHGGARSHGLDVARPMAGRAEPATAAIRAALGRQSGAQRCAAGCAAPVAARVSRGAPASRRGAGRGRRTSAPTPTRAVRRLRRWRPASAAAAACAPCPSASAIVLVRPADHRHERPDRHRRAGRRRPACAARRPRAPPAPSPPCRSRPRRASRPPRPRRPRFFFHSTRRPSSIVGESASITTLVAIGSSSR